MERNHGTILQEAYDKAIAATANEDYSTTLGDAVKANLDLLIERSEANKGLYTVALTLVTHKLIDPAQDVRRHQSSMEGGFAGRGKDMQYVTPFLKRQGFPAMAESGWLTRSLEQPMPYDLNYPGKITPASLKSAFLGVIDQVQCGGADPMEVLVYSMKLLIKQRDGRKIELAKPHSLSIEAIIKVLEKHFNYRYSCHGASRLPVLALYAVYQCMMREVARYADKSLCPLESHTSADARSGQIGDIQVDNADGSAFEGVEVKHQIEITPDLVSRAYNKFMVHRTDRYYLLTTAGSVNKESLEQIIATIKNNHGCQVIVNGVYSTLKYYLRLLSDPAEFVEKYVELLKTDDSVKYPHLAAWNEIIAKS